MLSINMIEDHCEWSLLDELRSRKVALPVITQGGESNTNIVSQKPKYFRSPEVGQLMKAIFKSILGLQSIELVHGNVQSSLVYFTSHGCIRIAGWYLDNTDHFENDFLDACGLVY
jgi:hypothetical protein